MVALTAAAAGFFTLGALMRGYGKIWALSFVGPSLTFGLYNHTHQPNQQILNMLNYIYDTREATVQMERYNDYFHELPLNQKPGFVELKQAMVSSNKTLFQVQSELADAIEAGKFQ